MARRLFFDLLADRKAFSIEEDEAYDWRIICLFLFTTIVLNGFFPKKTIEADEIMKYWKQKEINLLLWPTFFST